MAMESILARALEYTLKYWLKSFSRDQFKLQGRTGQLSNLDLNGDAVHASLGFPAALSVTTARVGKLEITLPSVSNVQYEPILVQIDRLDLVLEENVDDDNLKSPTSVPASTTSTKGSGYGFADKIADGMTLEVGTVNLMIETHGGARQKEGVIWSSPLASITMRNLVLYTTNENWQVVNLKEARDFSNNKKFIYVFKKLEWESLSVDLLPHPDMFMDARMASSSNQGSKRDDDGAKRLFFGGERFLEGISGEAYITVKRTELNSPLGLEVQLHIHEAVCPALSEPGLRALLRFMTGFYVCLNRGDVDLKAQQHRTQAAGCSLVSVIVDHIFLCIKDADFQLELLMQSLFFSRASLSDGETTKILSRIMLGGLFLRDTFSHPPCPLIQPSLRDTAKELRVPEFGQNFCPPIYPLGDQHMNFSIGVPLVSLHSLQIKPSPTPPKFASQTVIDCQPLMITLQEESCLRISSFLADGIVVKPGVVLPDFSVNSFEFTLKEFDLAVPLGTQMTSNFSANAEHCSHSSFSGARLHVEDLYFAQSPSIKCTLLNLDTDPACFSLWEYQPIDASQKKWTTRASHLSVSLETCNSSTKQMSSTDWYAGLWRCVEFHEVCFEAAMATTDGGPLIQVPPPEGVVRIGVSCQQYISNASVEQLFFVLDLYAYFGSVSEKITKVSKGNGQRSGESFGDKMMKKMPSDTAVSLAVNNLRLKFLESTSIDIHGMPLVQFDGQDLFLKVSHRTLGGAFAVSTNLHWETVSIYCLDEVGALAHENVIAVHGKNDSLVNGNGYPQLKAVLWIDNQSNHQKKPVPFLGITMVHVMPYDLQDTECHSLNASFNITGVRLGGGMNYTESLLHRFGILGPDGGPGEGLLKGLKNLSSGPLAKLFRTSPSIEAEKEETEGTFKEEDHGRHLDVRMPDDVDVCITFNNWLFALEGTQEMGDGWLPNVVDTLSREERCWHTTFQSLHVKAKSNSEPNSGNKGKLGMTQKFPVELIMVGIDGLQALKPRPRDENQVEKDLTFGNVNNNGVDVEVRLVAEEDDDLEVNWIVENVKFSVKQPIEAVATKEELEHLAFLCRSEADSMGRIAAGMLRLLKLDKSLGQTAIDQLSNLGSGSMHKLLTPDKLSRRSSFGSVSFTPRTPRTPMTPASNAMMEVPYESVESTVTLLEVQILDLQSKCSTLMSELSSSDDSEHVSDVKYLTDKLESMQTLLTRLRTLV